MSISGWGLFAILIVAFFVLGLLRYVKLGLKIKNVFVTQCISGFCRIILPLTCAYVLITGMKENLDAFLQALGCIILCELIAIPVNPMPKWVLDQQKDVAADERKDTVDYLLDGFFRRKKEEDK